MPEYVTVAEAAVILGIGYQRVLSKIRDGSIPAEKKGWFWLIKRADL